jgi:hypothetical protein
MAKRIAGGTISNAGRLTETKTATAATTNNVRVDSNGCGRA